ncbi:MAG TPA: MerR family transcriptional regulator [Candidatus Dormibacteraeota bacterium]|nr:MerR family transcriptional regulator [Candidatus Dormibacteraeota bacterium]
MPRQPNPELLSSGEFARRSRLSAKALRIYDQIGLLRPLSWEPSNGYRRYGADQLRMARLIAMLRGIDMSLSEIGALLEELGQDSRLAIHRLQRHVLEMENTHTSRMTLARHIDKVLREVEEPMFSIRTRTVPARRVMSMQRRLRASETDAFVREAKSVFAERLGSARPAGPFTLIFHGVVDDDSDGPVEATLACSDDVQSTELIGVRTEAAHDEAFTTITKAEWAYPAILAAYDAVACSTEVLARPGGRLSCREVYLAEPDAVGEQELICDIAFPLGDQAEAAPQVTHPA